MNSLAGLLGLAAVATAVDFTNWSPPGPGDGLNTMANHNFIPHSGKGMTLDILVPGLQQGLSVGPDFTLAIGGAALFSNPNQDLLNPYFDLDMIDEHDFPIEHDFSLSRGDYYFGDDHTFNQTIWNEVLAYFPDKKEFDLKRAVQARYHRVQESNRTNPDFTYFPQLILFSYGETALYLSTMGNNTNSAPYEYVKMFFEQEKLPYELGWRPATTEITLASLGSMAFQGFLDAGEELPEGMLFTESTFKAVFEGFSPVTGQLANESMSAADKAKAAGQIGSSSGKRWTA